jgi:uncharacterized protein (TIGR03437 family)
LYSLIPELLRTLSRLGGSVFYRAQEFSRCVLLCACGAFSLVLPSFLQAQSVSYTISTVAGNGSQGYNSDHAATATVLNSPAAVAVDSSGTLYIADSTNNLVRKLVSGNIVTIAGIVAPGYAGDGGKAGAATLNTPYGLTVDASGNIYIADLSNNMIREINTSGIINAFAGNSTSYGFSGDTGSATTAELYNPVGVAVDKAGNVYIGDSKNNRVRIVTAADGLIKTYAGDGVARFNRDGVAATSASLNGPFGVAVDSAGNLYIADSANNRVRKVTPAGIISTVAGTGSAGFSGDEGQATQAQLYRPFGVAVDGNGNLFIADYNNSRIREVTTDGIIHTVAGNGAFAYSGDGGSAYSASLNYPTGVAVDNSGNVYIADRGNNLIRMLKPTAPAIRTSNGAISAGAFGAFSTVAPGSWMEIYGSNLSFTSRSWTTADFQGSTAPTKLDSTSVTIGGQNAFIDYISAGQVNVQVPSGVGSGSQPVVVTSASGTSASYSVTVKDVQPGLLSPPSFNIGGTQFVTALLPDGTYVLPTAAIAGVTSRPAKAGDIITFYGVGFGAVNPNSPAGQIVAQQNTLAGDLKIFFGGTQAQVLYDGLAPNYVGLYQFNVVVPSVAASNAVPVTFTLNGTVGTQTLFTAIQQ